MADISLRAYLKEIDGLIEGDQLDEAISHCRHILQIYPKHLDTYRLLGKSYLEAKRFGDAADIFQRVLSAVPDDFVSHIGMAIVREDEGNVDAAVWHMERAFETNPANPAIRQELSRLIGRRDGIEPHKIRLTRGALARQYAQGELHAQAIAELRSALQEDAERPELEVLLAKMYWQAGQNKEARSISEQILEKLPFSFEANRIMAAIYEEEDRTDKAGEYHRRLAALEPYAAFSESSSIKPEAVDANAVRIDRYEWIPGQPLPSAEPGQPDWVASLGVDLSSEEEGLLEVADSPPWLTEIERPIPTDEPGKVDFMEPQIPSEEGEPAASEDEIPAWMKEAGWIPSSGEAVEEPVSFSDSELEALEAGVMAPESTNDEGELTPADIPSWLQDKAPKQEIESAEQTGQPEADAEGVMPDWLSEIADEAEEVTPDPEAEIPAPEEPAPVAEVMPTEEAEPVSEGEGPEVPSWIDDLSPGATSTIITWLGDRPEATEDEEEQPGAPQDVPSGDMQPEDVPSWLDDIAEGDEVPEVEETPAPAIDETPSWLAGVAEAASQQASAAEAVEKSAPTEPVEAPAAEDDWLDNLRAADAEAPPEPEAEEPTEEPDWLSGVPEPGTTTAEVDEPGTPDWLRGVREPEEPEVSPEPTPAPEAGKAPDWLQSGELDEAETAAPAQVPDWLQGIADQGPSVSTAPEGADEVEAPIGETPIGTPDWLQEYAGEGPALVESETEEPIDAQAIQAIEAELSAATEPAEMMEEAAPAGIGVEDELDDEEVFRWLESLADRQEGEEPATPTPQQPTPTAQPAQQLRQEAPPEEPDASLQWLEDLAAERGIDVDITPDLAPPTPVQAEPAKPAASEEPEQPESPDWLREMAGASGAETMVSIPRPPIPTHEAEPAQPEEAPSPTMEEPALDIPAPSPEEEIEVPDWLDEAATVASEVPPEPPVDAEMPAEESAATAPQPPKQPEVTPPAVSEPAADLAERAAEAIEPAQPPVDVSAAPATPPAKEPEAVAPAEKPEKQKRYKEPPTEAEIILKGARQALAAGDAGRALADYKKMINRKQDLDTVIEDLEEALERYPNLPTMWQALGDAYMKADRLAEAIQAYQRGMEVA